MAILISSGLTGSILLTQALLPKQMFRKCGISSQLYLHGIPTFTDSIAHPGLLPVNTGLAGLQLKLSYQLSKENIRVTGLYPPDFELTGLEGFVDSQPKMGERLMNGRSVWEHRFVLTQPRNCHIRSIYFEGPTSRKTGSQKLSLRRLTV